MQLKTTNLIFLEHSKLKLEKVELLSINNNYKQVILNDSIIDKRRQLQISTLENGLSVANQTIIDNNKTIKKEKLKTKLVSLVTGVIIIIALL